LRALAKELSTASGDTRPIAIGGPLADVLQRELTRGGDPRAVRVGGPERTALYLQIVGREGPDEEALKRARRARVPIVAIAEEGVRPPYVLAMDVVRLERGVGFPIDEIAEVIAHKLGEDGTALAARLPVLRGAICAELIRMFARKNAIVAAAVFMPGADLPVLTLNQLRLVLRIGAAHGETIDRELLPEIAATVGAGYGFRAVARQLLDLIPVAGWALKSTVAYAGTRTLGEAARQWFAAQRGSARAPVGDRSRPPTPTTPPPAEASRGVP
jgi:uncharacterized protein (DUF697 family)